MSDNNKMTDLPIHASARHMQSEMGVTGNYSPNIDLVNEVCKKLSDTFNYHRDTITGLDGYLFVSECYLGSRIGQGGAHMTTLISSAGSSENLVSMLSKMLVRMPDLMPLVASAMSLAIQQMMANRMPSAEGLTPKPPEGQ